MRKKEPFLEKRSRKRKELFLEKHSLKRKGISLLISWVLLVGFVVALAVFVTQWSRQQAEKNIGEVVEMIEGDARCNDVSLNAEVDCAGKKVNLVNRGYFTIYKLVIREYTETDINSFERERVIAPQEFYENFPITSDKMEIVPVIKIDDKFVGCSDRKAVVEC